MHFLQITYYYITFNYISKCSEIIFNSYMNSQDMYTFFSPRRTKTASSMIEQFSFLSMTCAKEDFADGETLFSGLRDVQSTDFADDLNAIRRNDGRRRCGQREGGYFAAGEKAGQGMARFWDSLSSGVPDVHDGWGEREGR